jgi:tRNA A-37 threonylcarbamoyl transferase component Bud32
VVVTGALLGERYRLEHLIGRGGMATVWSATDTVLGRPVAVKRLHAGLLSDAEHAERFRREAMLVARLSHPNLVHLLDRGEDPEGPYLVMQLVEGENLKALVRRQGALDPDEAARVCAQVGRALVYAHGQGVVHRDIKGQNVLITPGGGVKLADFGIARLIESDDQHGLTRTDMLMGSADYLSPEQAEGRPVDARTDVYSLGILLYECLTGALPFTGEGFVAIAMKQCSEPLPDPRLAAPEVPDWLASCALRAAAKDPEARFPSAAAMVAALEERQMSTAVPPVGRRASVADEDTARRARPRARRRRALWVGLAVAVLGGATAAGVIISSRVADRPAAVSAAGPLTLVAVRDYDPQGDAGAQSPENPDDRGLAVDADPATAWYTEKYRVSSDFGGLKTGVGLILRLSGPAVATELVVTSPTSGARFQVLGPLVGGQRHVLAEDTFTGAEQVVAITAAAASEAYVLWITSLVPDGTGGFWAGVGQVELRGAPNST